MPGDDVRAGPGPLESGPLESGPLESGQVESGRPAGPRVVQLPGFLAGGRFGVRGAAVVAVLAVVLLVGVVFALRVTAAQRAGEPVAVTSTRAGPTPGGPLPWITGDGGRAGAAASPGITGDPGGPGLPATGAATAGATSGAGRPSGPVLVVHVVGEVAAPGVVRVPEGARVVDVIAAAGGALAGADLVRINLASLVHDGEQVHVPAPGESILPGAFLSGGGGAAGAAAGAGSGAGSAGGGGPVDLNRADLGALDSLPGVGPVLAQRILDWRVQHGRFTSVDELGEVSGIGEKLLAQLRPKVSV